MFANTFNSFCKSLSQLDPVKDDFFFLQCTLHIAHLKAVKLLSVDKTPYSEVGYLFTDYLLIRLVLQGGTRIHQQSQDLKEKRM